MPEMIGGTDQAAPGFAIRKKPGALVGRARNGAVPASGHAHPPSRCFRANASIIESRRASRLSATPSRSPPSQGVLPVGVHAGERPLTEPTPAVQPRPQERMVMPLRRPSSSAWAQGQGMPPAPGDILRLVIMPEGRPSFVHRRLPAAADPKRFAALIRHRPRIAGDAGTCARGVDLEHILEPVRANRYGCVPISGRVLEASCWRAERLPR